MNESTTSCCQTTVNVTSADDDEAGGVHQYGFVFELRRTSGKYVLAMATVKENTVVLTLHDGAAGEEDDGGGDRGDRGDRGDGEEGGVFVGYRYAWDAFPLCVVTNDAGLPAAPVEM
jgi:hypothetical protein